MIRACISGARMGSGSSVLTGNDGLQDGALSGRPLRVLQLMRTAMGSGKFCVPIVAALRANGHEAEFACAIEPSEGMPPPEAVPLHSLPLSRRVGAVGSHLRALWACVRLMRCTPLSRPNFRSNQ